MRKTALLCALVMGTSLSPVYAGSGPIKVVLAEEADLLEPCMATRSNIGRIIMENVSETLTELDVRGGTGVQPRLAEKWEQNADGSWREEVRQGSCVTIKEMSSSGEMKITYIADDFDAHFDPGRRRRRIKPVVIHVIDERGAAAR